MDKSSTPEERLLKLIKEGVKPAKETKPPDHAAPPDAQPVLIARAQSGAGAPLKPRQKINIKKFFTITSVNKWLLPLFLLVLVYTIYDFAVFFVPQIAEIKSKKDVVLPGQVKASSSEKKSGEEKGFDLQPLTYYLQEIEKKDLFKSVVFENAGSAGQANITPAKSQLEELAKVLVLKGVIAGVPPQAVIEDTRAGKTYFVIKSDKIGEAVIDEIKEGRVKIKIGEESIDLVL